jgi:FSR family fosmidomycin resistance protein-like MFS transporter
MSSIQSKKSNKFDLISVLTITFSHHIHDIYTAFLPALQKIILETFLINNRLFGLLSVIQRIPTLFNPFIGILAERVRIRYLMISAPTITAISMSLIGNVSSYTSLAVLVFISGIGSSLFHVPTPVMMKTVSGNKAGVGMGFYMFGGEFARTVGPVIAAGALDIWGFSGMFRLIPAGLVSSALLFYRFRNTDLRKNFDQSEKNEGSYLKVFRTHLSILLPIAMVTFVRGGMKSIFTYYLIGYLSNAGWGNWKAEFGLSVVYLTGTAGSFLSGIVSDYIGKRTTLILSAFLPPLFILISLYYQIQVSMVLLGIIGFFLLANTPVFLSIVNSIKSKHVTFLNGIYMTSNFLMSALATILTGTGLDLISDYNLTLKISATIALFAVPIVIFMPLKQKNTDVS